MDLSRSGPTLVLLIIGAVLVAPLIFAGRMLTSSAQSPQSKSAGKAAEVVFAGFNGTRGYQYLVEQCEMGPRPTGSETNRKLRDRLAEHFRERGAQVQTQAFEFPHPVDGSRVAGGNVVGSWRPTETRRVLLCAHFDSRPAADEERDPRRKALPFLAANDGASGVAVLMELANLLPELKMGVGVDLAAFDAEEFVFRPGPGQSDLGNYFLGSTHLAREYANQKQFRYTAAILLDMVGSKTLQLFPDRLSFENSRGMVDEVWGVARKLRVTAFKSPTRWKHDVRDDHEPLIEAGIPAIDLIDFDYPHWHRASDTADKCSPSSLAHVGGVLVEWLKTK